jgi:hypothetical protein
MFVLSFLIYVFESNLIFKRITEFIYCGHSCVNLTLGLWCLMPLSTIFQ